MVSSINSSSGWTNYQMMEEVMQKHRDEMFNKADGNGDGGIDKAEFSALAKKMSQGAGTAQSVDDVFSTYDADDDGNLSQDELDAYMKENAPPPPAMGMGGATGLLDTEQMQKHRDEMFGKVDSNGDGSIDKTEFASLVNKIAEDTGNALDADEAFAAYDSNGDGQLSQDELQAFMEANRPPLPMQNAVSAYDTNSGTDRISSLLDYLQNQSATESDENDLFGSYLSNLLEVIKSGESNDDLYSLINIMA